MTRRGSIAVSWGGYGGFYCTGWRVCLGWVVLAFVPVELDDLMIAYAESRTLVVTRVNGG